MNKNIPNILTFSRGIATILIIIVMLIKIPLKLQIAFVFFIYASISDFLDGYLARKYNCISTFGVVFDSIFDKILILTMFMLFLPYQVISSGIFIALMFRDILIDGIKNFLLSKNKPVAARFSGKIKFFLQVLMIIFIFIYLISSLELIYYPMIICAYLTLFFSYYSAFFYLKDFFKLCKTN